MNHWIRWLIIFSVPLLVIGLTAMLYLILKNFIGEAATIIAFVVMLWAVFSRLIAWASE